MQLKCKGLLLLLGRGSPLCRILLTLRCHRLCLTRQVGTHSKIIVDLDFIRAGALRSYYLRGTPVYWHFSMCLRKYFIKRYQKRIQENSAPIYYGFGGRCISFVSAAYVSILDQYGPIMTAVPRCATAY